MDKYDLDINTITYNWVESTNDIKVLKKGLQLLKDDGGFFPDLERAIDEKLQQLDKKYKQSKNAGITSEDIRKAHDAINKWENDIKQRDQIINEHKDSSSQSYQIRSLEMKKQAENEKIKGNELMKTKEYDEAIRYYTKSIEMDSMEPTTYCNRALAYIQLKQYNKGLEDCEKAIGFKRDYIKAYYRRGICLNNLRKFKEGLRDFLFVLNDNPQSNDILDEITALRGKWRKDIGEESWKEIEDGVDREIALARKGQLKDERESLKVKEEEKGFKKIHIEEETIEDDNSGERNEDKAKSGFKKIVIEEEESIEDKDKDKEKAMTIEKESKVKEGFKKIKIEEDDDDNNNNENEKKTEEKGKKEEIKSSDSTSTSDDIPNELKMKFNRFIESGEQVKIELKKKIERKELKASEAIAHNCYLDCEKFIKKFKSNSIYFTKIESAINELKSLLNIIRIEMTKEQSQPQPQPQPTSIPIQSTQPTTTQDSSKDSKAKTEKATKLAEQTISFTDFPKTALGFEKAYNSFKSQPEVFYQFLKYFNGQTISQIYKNTELPNSIFTAVINVLTLKLEPLNDSYPMILDYLIAIPTTKKFSLIKNFLKEKDKTAIVTLLNEISAIDQSQSGACSDLIKAYTSK